MCEAVDGMRRVSSSGATVTSGSVDRVLSSASTSRCPQDGQNRLASDTGAWQALHVTTAIVGQAAVPLAHRLNPIRRGCPHPSPTLLHDWGGLSSLARSAGGLGVGLALAHRIVQLHGGTIEAYSPPEEHEDGTEVIVRLPRSKFAPHRDADSAVLSSEQAAEPRAHKGIRVLVVDDNVDLVAMFSTSLQRRGYSVRTAYNGPDGLKLAQTRQPDVVLLDIGLPGLDGYQVARRLRTDPATKGIRLIAVSGYGREADIELGRRAGFDAHMVKPCDVDDLEELMPRGE